MAESLTVDRVDWAALRQHTREGPRSEARKPVALSIEVCGFDRCGQFFTEQTETIDASEWGCKFRLTLPVEKDGIVAIRMGDRSKGRESETRAVLFQIAYAHQENGVWTMGATKLQNEPIWPPDLLKLDSPAAAAD
jgi:hypothetical protein